MRYLENRNTYLDSTSVSVRNLRYLIESDQFGITEPVIKSTPINIISISEDGDKKKVKYESDEVGIGGEWYFSYNDRHSRYKKTYEFFRVRGDAMLIDEKRVLRFDETFNKYDDAEKLYNFLIKKYPESQIVIDRILENPIKSYG